MPKLYLMNYDDSRANMGGRSPKIHPRIPRVPCSYISFLIGSAWNVDINDPFSPYFHRSSFQGSLLPANMRSGGGGRLYFVRIETYLANACFIDNNEGITVIDVTNPSKPAYCFVKLEESRILSAAQYAREYYANIDDNEPEGAYLCQEILLI